MNETKKISDERLKNVAGGTQAEADEWLAEVMKYYGVTTRKEVFAIMTEEQKHIYQVLLDNQDWNQIIDALDRP